MDCAPSVLTDLGEFDDEDDYNLRGSLLHHLGEQALKRGSYDVPAGMEAVGLKRYDFDDGDAESVAAYVDYVSTLVGLKRFEVHSWFIRGLCGGTSDAVILNPSVNTMEIVDYKAGYVRRNAKANYQLLIYALGAFRKFHQLFPISRVRLTIVQPMRDEGIPDSWTIKTSELERWGTRIAARVNELERMRAAGELGEYNPTPERCQFCPVAKLVKCPELIRAAQASADEDFSDYEREVKRALTDAEKWDIATRAETFIKRLRESVTSRVLAGAHVDGFKVVSGKGKWGVADKRGFVDHLVAEGFKETDIYEGEPRLLSLNKAKKLYSGAGSGEKRDKLETFFEKSEGSPTVVPESDRRPAIYADADADAEFANYKREGESTS
jgi:hypothetical protein